MDFREKSGKVRRIKFRIPRICICPNCRKKQKFRKHKEYWKRMKDMNVDKALLLEVRVIYAKCFNPNCPTRCFCLPTPGIKKRARCTDRLRAEAVVPPLAGLKILRGAENSLHLIIRMNASH